MRWILAAMASASVTAGCDRLLKIDEFADAQPHGDGGDGGNITLPPPCTPASFDARTPTDLFPGKSSSALTVSYDETVFVVEVKGSPNTLYIRHAGSADEVPIAPPVSGQEMAEPTLDPEGSVMYARDVTTNNTIVAYRRTSTDSFTTAPILSIPSGHRAGNQTLDLGRGLRRMMVQYDPGNMVFVFNEYEGSPTAGWNLVGTDTTATDLAGSSTPTIEDPSLSADGLNLTYTVDGAVYNSHRDGTAAHFGGGTKLLTGSFSSPVLGNSCRTLFVVDKGSQAGRRYVNP